MARKIIWDRLFIAVPELRLDIDLLTALNKTGVISDQELAAARKIRATGKKFSKFSKKLRGKALSDRLMTVVPELLTTGNVDLLASFGLLDTKTSHMLRLAIRAGGAAFGGKAPSDETILRRMGRVLGVATSHETIALMRALDNEQIEAARDAILKATGLSKLNAADAARLRELAEASIRNAERLRGVVSAGKAIAGAISAGKGADSILKAMFLIAPELMDEALVRAMVKAGVINGRTAEIMVSAISMGKTAWRNFARAAGAETLAQRMLLISQGVINHEMVNFLVKLEIISSKHAAILRPAITMMRNYTKDKLDEILDQSRRYRVRPGENPLQVYARGSRRTDAAILREIARAAKRAGETAENLLDEGGSGNRTRARQLQITRAALHDIMQEMWHGVGTLTIFGEAESARLAQVAMQELEEKLWRQYGKQGEGIRKALYAQARAGVDAYVSRQENLVELSRRVYKNQALAMGKINQIINSGLLQGKSAKEIADDVSKYINPSVRGGVRYAAMRLARTEINNAFHYSSIRYTREMPWVTGYKWYLSGSHPIADGCNVMASRDHDGMGQGVYKKSNVPGKPHPHCLCYITTVTVEPSRFAAGMSAGRYDQYLSGFTG